MDFNKNYFEIFQLPVAFDQDPDQLAARYRQLQSSVHPDRFVDASDQEKRLSLQWATQINAAYNVLVSGLARAIYLLELAGISIEDNPQLDPGFLMDQIELREQLEDISATAAGRLVDPDDDSEALHELDAFKEKIKNELHDLEEDFAVQFGTELRAAEITVYKMQFINKLLLEADKLEEKMLDY